MAHNTQHSGKRMKCLYSMVDVNAMALGRR